LTLKKNINIYEDDENTNLFGIIEKNNNIFIKMDIEGAELPWLHCLSEEQLDKLSQIVIEFHFPFLEKDKDLFKKLNNQHLLVHLHGNNCPAGTRYYKNIIMPNVFECTYIHKKFVNTPIELNTDPLPGNLDMPNCAGKDIDLNYPPFVHTLAPVTLL
jgi:hypothetical protein